MGVPSNVTPHRYSFTPEQLRRGAGRLMAVCGVLGIGAALVHSALILAVAGSEYHARSEDVWIVATWATTGCALAVAAVWSFAARRLPARDPDRAARLVSTLVRGPVALAGVAVVIGRLVPVGGAGWTLFIGVWTLACWAFPGMFLGFAASRLRGADELATGAAA
ncbi:MAG TPA: hypothetical protein VM618_06155 [Acidimicrobiia bacterium]|nr:hypothetical protein [Acidimicrobiia bacterium]